MCHNKETSLVIFIFSIALVIHFILEYTKTKDIKYIFVIMYLFALSSMQFVEFLIYLYKYKSIFASWLVLFAIVLQFLFSEIYIYYNKIFPIETCILDIIFYIAIFILIFMIKGKPINDTINCNHPYIWLGCKLNWGILDNMHNASTILTTLAMLIYVVYVSTSTYELFTPVVFGLFMAVYFISMILPKFVDKFNGLKNIKTFHGSSSGWCFFAIILMTMIIVLDEPTVIK
jgi:hypothetical protein